MRKLVQFLLVSMCCTLMFSNTYSKEDNDDKKLRHTKLGDNEISDAQKLSEKQFDNNEVSNANEFNNPLSEYFNFPVYQWEYNPAGVVINNYNCDDNQILQNCNQWFKEYIIYLKNSKKKNGQNITYLKSREIPLEKNNDGKEEAKEDYKITYSKFTYSLKHIIEHKPNGEIFEEKSCTEKYIQENYESFVSKKYNEKQINELIDQLLLDSLYFTNNYSTKNIPGNGKSGDNNSCKLFNLAWGILLKYTAENKDMSKYHKVITNLVKSPLLYLGMNPVKIN
ncbi:MAG: hypothetical protein IJ848_02345 [Alphaproteobacteria bacterium]|nr:hypothetical protein [Alphaproteobacteria bacterium]